LCSRGSIYTQSECKDDLRELCDDAVDAASIVQCLVISSDKVSPSCLGAITASATDSKCVEDVVRFCAKQSNIAECLARNTKQLSPGCRDEVITSTDAEQQVRTRSVSTSRITFNSSISRITFNSSILRPSRKLHLTRRREDKIVRGSLG
jgi:hypothetical protein